jgi:hypothetical protein
MQIDPRNLRRLVARAEALLDGRYEALEARRSKEQGIRTGSSS